ncbi:hypothetical protein [Paludibaculum fermentans]|uniref:hypothetical protein n=1 Tax=Paludibaculum fermentans TaxID=1473598 RepID=UPI003EB90C78
MNLMSLVRPIRSLQRFRSEPTLLPVGSADLLKAALTPGEGDARRCAANVVVYGGQSREAEEFAEAAFVSLEPLDSLWRVGAGEAADSRVVWIPADHPLLTMLNARVVFLPAGEQQQDAIREWQDRADAIFVVGGAHWDMPGERSGTVHKWQDRGATPSSPPLFSREAFLLPTSATIGRGRMEPLDVGDAHNDFAFECWSKDRRVHAIVTGRGGDLTVRFVTEDPQLKGAVIRFAFRTGAGATLPGERQLWPDEANPAQIVAFWAASQLDFKQSESPPADRTTEAAQMTFSFEVLPSVSPGE